MTIYPDFVLRRINESFNLYEVVEDCQFTRILTVPKGFVTDFASVPRWLWALFPPHGAAMPASVLHDFCYTVHPREVIHNRIAARGDIELNPYDPVRDRLIADRVFRNGLLKAGISKLQAEIMYRAVRWFGAYRFKHYGKSRKTVRKEREIKQNRKEKGV